MQLWCQLNPYTTIPDEIKKMQGRIKRKARGKGKMKKPQKPDKNKLIEKELSEKTDGLNNSELEDNKS